MNLDTRAMENLPLSGYRNFQSLINLVPGATPARFQNAVTDTPGRALSTNVNGQERGANNTRVDGSADILVTMPHHAVYVPPVESIQEVNISTNNFDAEQGMTGGAAVTVITKSGTNDFRGSAFAMHDNSALRAFTWDENRAGVTGEAERPRETSTAAASAARSRRTSCSSSRTGKARSNAWATRALSPSRQPTSAAGISAACWGRRF